MAKPDDQPDSNDAKTPMDSGKTSKKSNPGWIENFAQRSSGIPTDEPPESPKDPGDKSLWRLAGFGLQFAGTVGLFAFMGYELDKKMGWSPWGTVTLSMLAVIGNLYLLIKEVIMEPNAPKKKK